MSTNCDFCGSANIHEVSYDDVWTSGRRKISLAGLKKLACPDCGEEYVTAEQSAFNHGVFEKTVRESAEAVTPGLLRTLRHTYELTQKEASRLFRAGDSAFGKWESGATPSGPAALLIQCALYVPGVMDYLRSLASDKVEKIEKVESFSRWTDDDTVIEVLSEDNPYSKALLNIANIRRVTPLVQIQRMSHYEECAIVYGDAA